MSSSCASPADLLSDGYPRGNTGHEPNAEAHGKVDENFRAEPQVSASSDSTTTNVQVNLRIAEGSI